MTGRSSVGRAPAHVPESQKVSPSRRTAEKSSEELGPRSTSGSGQSRGGDGARHTLEAGGSSPSARTISPGVAQRSERRSDRPDVTRFNSRRLDHFTLHWPKLTWMQPLGPAECPYLIRTVLDFGAFALRLHKWENSDDLRHPHDHPWDYWTLVLWGTITEHSEEGTWERHAGSFHAFTAEFKHCVEVKKPAWTFMVTGPERRPKWGFWVNGKFRKRNKYFYEYGHHHPCDPTQNKVRRRDRKRGA